MGLKAYIPFTQARRERLYAASLQNMVGDYETLMQIEWPDDSITYEPAAWHPETSAWLTESGKRFYQKGKGTGMRNIRGVPVVPVHAENAGVVTTEASVVAKRELDDDYVDQDGNELEVVEKDENGDPRIVEYADEVAADGGELVVGEDIELHYDQSAPDGYDGEVISRSDAGLIDPYPVSRQEADQAVAFAKSVGQDATENIRWFIYGLLAGFGLIAVFIGFLWLLGEIGGGSTGVSVGLTIGGALV